MAGQRPDPTEWAPSGFFVQVRYPQSSSWVTVAVADDRAVASTRAGELFYRVRGPGGEAAIHVRVISATALLATGGPDALEAAGASMAEAARRVAGVPPEW